MTVPPKPRRIEVQVSDEGRRREERDCGQLVRDDEAARGFLTAIDADASPPPGTRELFAREVPWPA